MIREPGLLDECRALQRALEPHATLEALHAAPEWPDLGARLARLLGTVRSCPASSPPAPSPHAGRVRAVHWNIEHGNAYAQVEDALCSHPDLRDADVILLNEVDIGMARSGNRDVASDLARSLGRHAAFAPLFLETSSGRDDDAWLAAGRRNEEGLFGLAILSRWPIGAARIVELPSPTRAQFESERMYGLHVALAATVQRPGAEFVAVSAHLEVHRTRAHRAAQMHVLVGALSGEAKPVLLAGDFNSHTFDRGLWHAPLSGASALLFTPGAALRRRLLHPDHGRTREPLFDELRRGGFEWAAFTDREPTLQLRFERLDEMRRLFGPAHGILKRALRRVEKRARLRLDWFAGRGWRGGHGHTVTGLDGPGRASDHAPIVAEFER